MSKNTSERNMTNEEREYYTSIGEFIKTLIATEHKSQLDFACKIGISYSLLSKQLNGIRPMRLYTYSKICDGLGIPEIGLLQKIVPTPYEKERTKLYVDLYQKLSTCSPETIKKIIDSIEHDCNESSC